MFKALLIEKTDSGQSVSIQSLDESALPPGDVLLDVAYSTMNYKDSLAITGTAPIVRNFPLIPGIDCVGTVVESASDEFQAGDKVILNGWGVGEKHWGGLGQKARVSADWLIHLPNDMDPWLAMAIGTAGYTAMLCVMALKEHGVTPDSGPVLVTGATGGVGAVAIAILAKRGFEIAASTGKAQEHDFLRELGATAFIDRHELSEPARPLAKERWAAAIDAVGGHTLANVCAGLNYGGIVAACGMAQSLDFPASVAPFILRGITLKGVDSVMCPKPLREIAWRLLADEIDGTLLKTLAREISLDEVQEFAQAQIEGRIKGRVVVNVQD